MLKVMSSIGMRSSGLSTMVLVIFERKPATNPPDGQLLDDASVSLASAAGMAMFRLKTYEAPPARFVKTKLMIVSVKEFVSPTADAVFVAFVVQPGPPYEKVCGTFTSLVWMLFLTTSLLVSEVGWAVVGETVSPSRDGDTEG